MEKTYCISNLNSNFFILLNPFADAKNKTNNRQNKKLRNQICPVNCIAISI